ncbi:hypothetical protein GGR95_003188 [Sulfitobacter undariae]|uniref:Uncharacterized protein n=1 Tax=Sulfitobacter undariae TaxID=1563671 RepID=A0A7W6E8R6_9RHOB|nr:hypothetical protein [Sulfitobacter undariae]MBB3995531.1 hypothetical protein [Sulfitobacter undariae]
MRDKDDDTFSEAFRKARGKVSPEIDLEFFDASRDIDIADAADLADPVGQYLEYLEARQLNK